MIDENEIKKIIKGKKVFYGYRQAKKALKDRKTENIIVASRGIHKKEFKGYLEFEGEPKKLGLICGKPFAVSVIAVLKED